MKRSNATSIARETKKAERGVFVLLDIDSTDDDIETAVRALMGLPDDYNFESEGGRKRCQRIELR